MFIKILVLCLITATSSYAAPPFTGIAHNFEIECSDFPFQISLQYGNSFIGYFHVCSGAIITNNWVLTAGHCIVDKPQLPFLRFRIVAGVNNLKETEQISIVKQIIVHPNYKGDVNPNDIALLQLEDCLELGERANAVQLPEREALPVGMSILSRWRRAVDEIIPVTRKHLHSLELPLMTYEECAGVLTEISGDPKPLASTNICTASQPDGKAACLGDSGGPLVACDEFGPTLIGIVSWGVMPCNYTYGPSVYTRVSAFLDFIYDNIH